MGLQGNKATCEHDFLSLYTSKDPSVLQLHDSKSPPPSQGFFLKTQDFLQPLEKPPPLVGDAGDKQERQPRLKQHSLPGGVATFGISHVTEARPAAAAAVKAEPPFVLWGQPAVAEAGTRGHFWSVPVAGAGRVTASWHQPPEKKGRFMDAGSGSSGGAGFDDDDGLPARREVSSSLKELTVRVEGKSGSVEQRPSTPRSKHSATEQRRRSKINDRFQILRELLPHSDQKRDKASFLLEVIEYIRFLQEKVQKHEVSSQEWNQETAKILPWTNLYFRSFWKNTQNKGQIPGDAPPDPSQIIRNGSSPEFNFSGKLDDNHNMVTPAAASGAQDQAETDHMASMSYRSAETPTNVANNVTSQPQTQWAGLSGEDDCAVNSKVLADQELTIDEGTISLSSQYSQELLTTLTHTLQNSGIDMSQASVSVQINLGKRAAKRPAAGATSSTKELTYPASNNETIDHCRTRLGDASEELATKWRKLGNS